MRSTCASSTSDDRTVRLWRVSDGAPLGTCTTPDSPPYFDVALAPDASIVAAASYGGTIWLWQVPDCELLGVLEGHTTHVLSVAFSRDGTLLVSGSEDGTVRLWGVRP